MFDQPIRTVDQAKAYFRAMGCSHMHMAREFPERYEEYRALSISQQTEREWRLEQFNEYYATIMENPDPILLWNLHADMYRLFESLRSETALARMLEATQHIRDRVPLKDRVIVAETIVGRTVREARLGLVYIAYDLGNTAAARAFTELALHFSTYVAGKSRGRERSRRATDTCESIRRELGL